MPFRRPLVADVALTNFGEFVTFSDMTISSMTIYTTYTVTAPYTVTVTATGTLLCGALTVEGVMCNDGLIVVEEGTVSEFNVDGGVGTPKKANVTTYLNEVFS